MKTLRFLLSTVVAVLSLTARAKMSDWTDAQGKSFRGEPAEALGPFAVFRTGGQTGRRLLFRQMSPADCSRFYQEIAAKPAPAARWSDATGEATGELPGHVLELRDGKLVPADLANRPEPQLLLVLYGSHNDGEGWNLSNNLPSLVQRIQRVYPGLVGTVFFGIRHNQREHVEIATGSWMPWLVTELSDQPSLHHLLRFAPREGAGLMLLTRDGVPLLSSSANSLAEIRTFVDTFYDVLGALNPANPRFWPDRQLYQVVTRPLVHAADRADPLLVGNPLRADGLRLRGVGRVDAQLDVAADGTVTKATLTEAAVVPEPLRAKLEDALRRSAVVAPAIDHGQAVAGTLAYSLVVPPENKQAEADAAWLAGDVRREIPVASWLVLRPIHVSEQDFAFTGQDATGRLIARPMEISNSKVGKRSQLNAFNSDWFGDEGAGTVHPAEGDGQVIDGERLVWSRIKTVDGYVDFQQGLSRLDYCIGYAWTEVTVPADTDAWLGIGSDDGMKIWLNGTLINDKWIRRLSRLDDDVVPLHLKKGANQFLIKIQNVTGDWSFVARLRTRER